MRRLQILILSILVFIPLKSQINESPQKSGITTINGSIKNFKKYYKDYQEIEIQVSDWTNARRRIYFSNIDTTTGNFSSSFFIFNNQSVLLIYKNKLLSVFVNPRDTLNLNINADVFPSKTVFKGKTANECKTLETYSNWHDSIFNISKTRINMQLRDSLSFEKYHFWRDSVYKTEMKNLDAFIRDVKPDNSLKQYFTADAQLRYYWDLLNYKTYKKKIIDNNTIDPVTIINSFQIDTIRFNIKQSNSYSLVVNQLYSKIHDLMVINLNKDHPIIINREKNRERKPVPMPAPLTLSEREELSKKDFPYYVKSASVIKNYELRESVLAHYYSVLLEQNIDVGIDSILKYISNPDIKSSLIRSHNSFRLKKANQTGLSFNSNLIDELASKYKGYVLYIDFWGTWCGPCYETFKHTSEIKNALKDKKVKFIYLCCRCNENEWQSAIKKYNLDGEHIFLTPEQLQLLSKEFDLIGVPQFVIVDSNGRIANDHAPRPSSNKFMQQQLINELKSNLK